MVELFCVVLAHHSIEQCIDVFKVFKVNCKGNGAAFFQVSLEFLFDNLDMFVRWIRFSVSVRSKFG